MCILLYTGFMHACISSQMVWILLNFDEFWNEINLARASEKFRSVISNSLEFNIVQSAHHLDSELRRNQNWEHHGQLWPNVNVIHLIGSALTHAVEWRRSSWKSSMSMWSQQPLSTRDLATGWPTLSCLVRFMLIIMNHNVMLTQADSIIFLCGYLWLL